MPVNHLPIRYLSVLLRIHRELLRGSCILMSGSRMERLRRLFPIKYVVMPLRLQQTLVQLCRLAVMAQQYRDSSSERR